MELVINQDSLSIYRTSFIKERNRYENCGHQIPLSLSSIFVTTRYPGVPGEENGAMHVPYLGHEIPQQLPYAVYRPSGRFQGTSLKNKTKQNKRKSAERIMDRYRPCQNRPADPGTTEVEAPRRVTDLHPSSRTVGAEHARPTYDAACKANYQPTNQL